MLLLIGPGAAGTMITHCIAVAAHLTEVVVVNLKELSTYQKEPPRKEIILFYTAPQLDEIIFDYYREEKIKHDVDLLNPLVSLIPRKYWFHPLWNKPP